MLLTSALLILQHYNLTLLGVGELQRTALLSLYFLGYHILTCLSLISYRKKASRSRDKTHALDRQPHFSFSSMQTPSHSALPLRRRSEPGSVVYSIWLRKLTCLTARRAAASPQPSPGRSHLQNQLKSISSTVRRFCDHEHDTTTNERLPAPVQCQTDYPTLPRLDLLFQTGRRKWGTPISFP